MLFRSNRTMKTLQQQETEAILAMFESMKALEQQLSDAQRELKQAHERIRQLESQVYNGSTQ